MQTQPTNLLNCRPTAGFSWLWTTKEAWNKESLTFWIGSPQRTTMVGNTMGGHVGVSGPCCCPRTYAVCVAAQCVGDVFRLLPRLAMLTRVACATIWDHIEACGPCSWGPWVRQWSWYSQGPHWCLLPVLQRKPMQMPTVWAATWIHVNSPGWEAAPPCSQHCRISSADGFCLRGRERLILPYGAGH